MELLEIKCPSEICEDLIVLKDLKEHLKNNCNQFIKDFECEFCCQKIRSIQLKLL